MKTCAIGADRPAELESWKAGELTSRRIQGNTAPVGNIGTLGTMDGRETPIRMMKQAAMTQVRRGCAR